jgi:hypothetical protein
MQTLPIQNTPQLPPNEYSGYQDTFEGPSLKCGIATGSDLSNISAIANEIKKQVFATANAPMDDVDIKYLSVILQNDQFSPDSTMNVSEYVSQCILDTRIDVCKRKVSEVTLWAQLGNESITCAVHNTQYKRHVAIQHYGMQMNQIRFEWRERTDDPVALYIVDALTSLLNGFFGTFTADGAGENYISRGTMITNTALLELLQRAYEPLRSSVPQEDWMRRENRTFAEIIEELSRNQTLSLSSNDRFWVPMANASFANVTYQMDLDEVVSYEYDPSSLWRAYGTAIALSLVAVILGLRALWINGVSHDNAFSSIMATTRSRYLDELTMGHSLGATPMSKEVLGTKLRFGKLSDGTEKRWSRAGFGVSQSVQTLNKGQVVY